MHLLYACNIIHVCSPTFFLHTLILGLLINILLIVPSPTRRAHSSCLHVAIEPGVSGCVATYMYPKYYLLIYYIIILYYYYINLLYYYIYIAAHTRQAEENSAPLT
jgi:hypothetical protein